MGDFPHQVEALICVAITIPVPDSDKLCLAENVRHQVHLAGPLVEVALVYADGIDPHAAARKLSIAIRHERNA